MANFLDKPINNGVESFGCGQQLRFSQEKGGALAALAPELPAVGEDLLVVVALELFMKVAVLLVDPSLLLPSLLGLLVQASLDLFLQGSELSGMLGLHGIAGSLDFKIPGVDPSILLTLLQLLQPHLHLVSLRIPTYQNPYNFCLAICSSIFFKFKNSELSFTL